MDAGDFPCKLDPRISQALELVCQASLGRAMVAAFLKELREGRVSVQELGQAPKGVMPVQPGLASGGFYYDGEAKVIYADLDESTEILAAILVHEITHCLDREFLESWPEQERLRGELSAQVQEAAQNFARSSGRPANTIELGELPPRDRKRVCELFLKLERFSQERVFRSERRAYQALYAWAEQAGISRSRVLGRKITDQEIIEAYGLDRLARSA